MSEGMIFRTRVCRDTVYKQRRWRREKCGNCSTMCREYMTFSIFPCVKMFFETSPPLVPLGGGGRGLWIEKRGGGGLVLFSKLKIPVSRNFQRKYK